VNRVRGQAPPFGAFAVTSERGRSDPALTTDGRLRGATARSPPLWGLLVGA
jgi:hypothetical protein